VETLVFGISIQTLAYLIPALPLIGALSNGAATLIARRRGKMAPKPFVTFMGVGTPLLAFAITLFLFTVIQSSGNPIVTKSLFTWIEVGDLSVPVSLLLDQLSVVMTLVITGVGSLIHIYSVGYMNHDKSYDRYFTYLNLFLFSMLILVLGNNLPLMFIGWEGVGLCSYLLIGFWFEDPAKASAGKKAFVVNRIGDFGFLLAMFLLYVTLSGHGIDMRAGSLNFSTLEAHQQLLAPIATVACLLLFVGAAGKSAQIPLYVWLPDAMAGPTPVSALIHAATMVTAGVYMIARLNFLYLLSPEAMMVVATVGAITALFAATMGLAQNDIKKILAYSTISQLGYMFLAVGVGAFSAGIFHVVTHAFFKACLFLGAGSVIHGLHEEQNIWKMGGLRRKMPVTFLTFLLAVAAIVGIVPFAGFFSKDEILFQTFIRGHKVLWAMGFATAGITAFYMCRLFALTFFGTSRMHPKVEEKVHESPISMTFPLLILGILSLVGGWVGIPEALKGHNYFHHWLQPILGAGHIVDMSEHAHGTELILAMASFLWVFHIGLLAIILYSQKLSWVDRLVFHFNGIYRTIQNKYYIDEIYNLIFIKPIHWLSRNILWKFGDEQIIDGLMVNGSAKTAGLVGRLLSLFQTGWTQHYALFLAVGTLALIAYFIL
jgi:NADH-quinone oxidoreductase subunit L